MVVISRNVPESLCCCTLSAKSQQWQARPSEQGSRGCGRKLSGHHDKPAPGTDRSEPPSTTQIGGWANTCEHE
ncbi:hypothetical protein M514_02907 [Trichuris suis]|uniref:Uncharacterized protein n=1 Tax=Trichuris suis TaxID=68888 RepID=A0A085MFY3_9BILA|nr:hypothetical protein M513_02907 [Trichuris suis]KFD66654.1 hypothetical protein M514_02907 [Trichuris suis]